MWSRYVILSLKHPVQKGTYRYTVYTQVPLESSTCSANTSTCSYVRMCFFPFSPLENRQSRTILRLSPGLWINPSFSGYKDGPLCTPVQKWSAFLLSTARVTVSLNRHRWYHFKISLLRFSSKVTQILYNDTANLHAKVRSLHIDVKTRCVNNRFNSFYI